MRNWINFNKWGGWAAAGILMAQSALAQGGYRGSSGGGGEIPTPFEAYNQKVELADGESYLLIGRIVIDNVSPGSSGDRMRAFFEIDLDEHPWLGNAKRKVRPFYPLEGPVSYWRQFRGQRVKLPCMALAGVAYTPGQPAEYVIWLRRLSNQPVEPHSGGRAR